MFACAVGFSVLESIPPSAEDAGGKQLQGKSVEGRLGVFLLLISLLASA